MKKQILSSVNESIRAVTFLQKPESINFIQKAAEMIASCLRKKNKLLIAGNGGSLCDAMHFTEELTGYFRKKRPALAAIALSDPGHLTCTANDSDFDQVFKRSVEALGQEGDIFIALTTSGNSLNLFNALNEAKKKNMQTISFLGKTGGMMKGLSDLEMIIEDFIFSDRIQEAHMAAIHIIIEMMEKLLFSEQKNSMEKEMVESINA